MTQKAPVLDFGGQGPLLHFLHANGYPPAVYNRLLSTLASDYRVLASEQRPLWRPPLAAESLRSWDLLVEDLLRRLRPLHEAEGPVIAVGHSLGASVSLMAACREPQHFAALVMIEPPLLPRYYHWALRMMRGWAEAHVPLINTTLRRRDHWRDEAAVFAHFRRKAVFARLSDQVLWDYVRHGTEPAPDGGRQLRYSKHWEARIYATLVQQQKYLQQCQVPLLALRGSESDALVPQVWQQWQLSLPRHQFVEFPHAGHLLPLEAPDELARVMRERLPTLVSI